MRYSILLYTIITVLLFSVANSATQLTVFEAVDRDKQKGLIDNITALRYKLKSITSPEHLPSQYQNLPTVKPHRCLSPFFLEVQNKFHLFKSTEQTEIQKLLARPNLPLVKETTNFKIHYTLSGAHAAQAAYIDSAAVIFENSWSVEVNKLGFNPPPVDEMFDRKYDVYLQDTKTAFGWSFYGVTTVATNPRGAGSYIIIDNDFQEIDYYTKGIDALKVTAAHEFFHAVQYGYTYFPYADSIEEFGWWIEFSATWMEDYVYDHINDYYNAFFISSTNSNSLFILPHLSLLTFDGIHEYTGVVFLDYLVAVFGISIMHSVLTELSTNLAMLPHTAVQNVLKSKGSSLEDEYSVSASWNYFTGSRADTVRFLQEGPGLPEIFIDTVNHVHDLANNPVWPTTILHKPEYLGTNYIVFNSVAQFDSLRIVFNGAGSSRWDIKVLKVDSDTLVNTSDLALPDFKSGAGIFKDLKKIHRLVMVVNNIGQTGNGAYSYSIETFPPGINYVNNELKSTLLHHEEISFSFYPQPVNNFFSITFSGVKPPTTEVLLLDLNGTTIKKLHPAKVIPEEQTIHYHLQDVMPGVYFMHFTHQHHTTAMPVVIVRD